MSYCYLLSAAPNLIYRGLPSGGTLATIFAIAENYSLKQLALSSKSWALSPISPPKGTSRAPAGPLSVPYIPLLGHQTYSVQATADRAIVQRSWGLIGEGKFYGSKFSFYEYARARSKIWGFVVKILWTVVISALLVAPVR